MTFGHGIVNGFAIIRPACRQRRDIGIALIEQFRKGGNVTDIIRGQFRRDDFMRVGIHAQMQLPPPAAQPDAVFLTEPFALAVNLEAGAVDEEMQWRVAVDTVRQDRQAAAPAAQGGMIRDRDINPEHVGGPSQHALGLTQRLMEYQAKRKTSRDGNRRIERLTTPLSSSGGRPCRHGFFGNSHREASPPHQRGIVFRPVRYPIPGHWDLVTAVLVELVRHGASERWGIARLSYSRSSAPSPPPA